MVEVFQILFSTGANIWTEEQLKAESKPNTKRKITCSELQKRKPILYSSNMH